MTSPAATDRGEHVDSLASLSLYEITRQFPRECLIVQPLEWTARHLHLLRCAFLEISEPPERPQSQQTSCPWVATEDPSVTALARELGRVAATEAKASTLQSIMEFCSFTKLPDPLVFRFRKYYVHLLGDTYVPSSPDSGNLQSFSVAYVDRWWIEDLRKERFSWRRLRYLIPDKWFRDPYIAGLLIAQAQRRQRDDAFSDPNTPNTIISYKVHVLLHASMRAHPQMHVYTAYVTNTFLSKLTHPMERPGPPDATRLDILHTTVPYEPHESFHLRLMEALHDPPRGVKRRRQSDEPS